jgi:membrane-bound serine protease (ClpP class)
MRALLRRPFGTLGALLVLLGTLAAACGDSTQPAGRVHVLTWDGVVNPIMHRYIDRGIDTAEESAAAAVVIRLDTPGGLDSAMRDVIQRIEASRVPVIVQVAPAGARAASAGTFITMAGHVAAMSPNTAIGAATPINSSGDDIEGALGRKVTNDAVAYIRGIAELRGRNADWAESAVRDAVSVNENDAVELNVVDFVATSIDDLLAQSNGREVEVVDASGNPTTVTVDTANSVLYENDTNLVEELLDVLATPDIAFLLLTLGGLALVIEILTPGFGIGVVGVVMLILAYFSLGALPTNEAGVALIVLGLVLLAAEVFISGFGVFGIAGTVSLVLGGFILFSDSGGAGVDSEVSRWLIFSVAAVVGLVFFLFVAALVKDRRARPTSGREQVLGAVGRSYTRLDPSGYVDLKGERWDATADDPPIDAGEPVVVTDASSIHLRVRRETPAAVEVTAPAGGGADDSRQD